MNTAHVTIILVAALYVIFCVAIAGALVYLFVLVVKALKKYIGSKEIREEKKGVCRSLGETLKENRLRCKMTQEFVSEALGVSRQAVSKWENGTSDPSTSNLIAIAKLYGVSSEELLRTVDNRGQEEHKAFSEEKD